MWCPHSLIYGSRFALIGVHSTCIFSPISDIQVVFHLTDELILCIYSPAAILREEDKSAENHPSCLMLLSAIELGHQYLEDAVLEKTYYCSVARSSESELPKHCLAVDKEMVTMSEVSNSP